MTKIQKYWSLGMAKKDGTFDLLFVNDFRTVFIIKFQKKEDFWSKHSFRFVSKLDIWRNEVRKSSFLTLSSVI